MAVLAGGVRIGVLTAIVLSLLAPLAIMSGLSPVPWVPREALDKIHARMAQRGTTLAQAIDASGSSGPPTTSGPLQKTAGHILMSSASTRPT